MNRGSQVIGLWPNRAPEQRADDGGPDFPPAEERSSAEEPAAPEVTFEEEQHDTPARDWARLAGATLCAVIAIAWVAFLAVTQFAQTATQVAQLIAIGCAPLAVIGIVYGLIMRGGRAEASRFVRVSAELRAENSRLETTLARATAELARQRASLGETNAQLLALGADATQRFREMGNTMHADIDLIARHAESLHHSAETARAGVAVLLGDLPKATDQTREMVVTLQQAGSTANDHAERLGTQLSALTAHGREADAIAGGAADKLAVHLVRIDDASATAGARLSEATAAMTDAIEGALEHSERAGHAARQSVEAQGAAMIALVDQAQIALARTGAEAAHAIASRIEDAGDRVEAMGALLSAQSEATTLLMSALRDDLDSLDGRFAALDEHGSARTNRLAEALALVSAHAGTLTGALEVGTGTADALIGRTETLLTAMDATAREIDETLPAAFDRLDLRAQQSTEIVARTSPGVEALERNAAAALDRLMEAEALLAAQRVLLNDFAAHADTSLSASGDATRALVEEVAKADGALRELANGASSKLVEALVRVRETAQVAADRAREAIGRVIPDSAEKLAGASRDALSKAISEQVEIHIAGLGTTAERAVESAQKATDRLARQMVTIANTSAAIETRIAAAHAEVQDSDHDNFARRVAMLIESLNSTAIDVTRILSIETTDAAWASYLRGDRGVFTRRAVRLLDAGEVREILKHYDADAEFREQVNRYIHDFEAMLRNVLATRDGSALGVTLLSSDMGKLYVALAQAIERLRT